MVRVRPPREDYAEIRGLFLPSTPGRRRDLRTKGDGNIELRVTKPADDDDQSKYHLRPNGLLMEESLIYSKDSLLIHGIG